MNLQQTIEISSKIQGWMSDKERAWLYEQATKCDTWVELGVYYGRSLFAVAMGIKPNGKIYTVDNGTMYFKTLDLIADHRPDVEIVPIVGDSAESVGGVSHQVDCVFIDADHSHDAVVKDINTWFPKVKSGGVICGHDFKEVESAIRATIGDCEQAGHSIWFKVV